MLTDTKLRHAKARSAPYKLADHGGLYLYVSPFGAKSWRYDYRLNGKRETLTIGKYPNVSLVEARGMHAEARKVLVRGISPTHAKRQERAVRGDTGNTFQAIAEEWYKALAPHRSKSWRVSTRHWLEKKLYPAIGGKPVRDITPADILAIMQRLERDGTAYTANYVRQTASRVFTHAIRNLRASYDPAQSLRGAIVTPRTKHHTALTAKELPTFLKSLDDYGGRLSTKLAAELLLLTFVRKSELIKATWEEIDLDLGEWRIPSERMKAKTPHLVPLSAQAIECFRQLQTLACGSRFVIPHLGDPGRPMGHSTLNNAFSRMGYQRKLTVHGLRGTASTILNEHGFKPDVIERQLAHVERNRIRAAYNHAEYLPERRAMMQHWADYLDGLQSVANVVALRTA